MLFRADRQCVGIGRRNDRLVAAPLELERERNVRMQVAQRSEGDDDAAARRHPRSGPRRRCQSSRERYATTTRFRMKSPMRNGVTRCTIS